MSTIADQNAATATMLITDSHTNAARLIHGVAAAGASSNAAHSPSMLAASAPYTARLSARRPIRAAAQPYAGTIAIVTTNVAVNSHCSCFTPPAMPISSRTERSTNVAVSTHTNCANAQATGTRSPGSRG